MDAHILNYVVKVKTLDEYDRIVQYARTNYSVTGDYHFLGLFLDGCILYG